MSRAYDFAETKILYMLYGYVYHLCKCNLIVILRGFLMGLSSITKHFAEVGWVWKSSMFLILQFLFPHYEFWQSRLEFFLPWLHTWNMIAIIKTSISTKFIRSHQYLSDTSSCFFSFGCELPNTIHVFVCYEIVGLAMLIVSMS